MSDQEKRKYLKQYGIINKEVERLSEEVARWRCYSEKITPTYSAQPKGNSTDDKIQNAVEKINELTDKLIEMLTQQNKLREDIYIVISSVKDCKLVLILMYHYIDGLTLDKIARKMNYSCTHIKRLHNKALHMMIMQ